MHSHLCILLSLVHKKKNCFQYRSIVLWMKKFLKNKQINEPDSLLCYVFNLLPVIELFSQSYFPFLHMRSKTFNKKFNSRFINLCRSNLIVRKGRTKRDDIFWNRVLLSPCSCCSSGSPKPIMLTGIWVVAQHLWIPFQDARLYTNLTTRDTMPLLTLALPT